MSGFTSKLNSLILNHNFILSPAIWLGLPFGQEAWWTKGLVLPVLAFVMVLSTTSLTGPLFRSPRAWIAPMLSGVAMNYGVLGGLILVLSRVILLEECLRIGFVVLAAVPSAVAVLAS